MLVNDYGSDNAYAKFIEMNNQPNTLVILISSSGKSQNIITAMMKASQLNCNIITLSGFDEKCPLNVINVPGIVMKYHVNDSSYGVIENAHQIFLHSIIKA
jgi:phosphoheptose isomerase